MPAFRAVAAPCARRFPPFIHEAELGTGSNLMNIEQEEPKADDSKIYFYKKQKASWQRVSAPFIDMELYSYVHHS